MPFRPSIDAFADPLAEAKAILDNPYGMGRDEAPRAFILLSLARREGSVDAAYLLGKHYQKDRDLALACLMEAAKKDHAQAALELGELAWGHVQGHFARPWPLPGEADALAVQWLERSASLGSPQAWAMLARILEARSPQGKLDETARTAWVMAAEAGDPGAKVMLALRLRRMPDSMARAHPEDHWYASLEKAEQLPYFFQKAAELLPKVFTLGLYKRYALLGSPLAMGFLGWLLRSNPKDDWHDPESALLWVAKAARLGNVDQMVVLANQLWQSGEEEHRAEILSWTHQAVEAGRWMAGTHLAQKYFGRGLHDLAMENLDHAWEVLARELGRPQAGEAVLEKFVGGEEEMAVAQYLAAKGVTAAQRHLGLKYTVGGETAQAATWLEQAAAVGDAQAQCALADLYLRGEGLAQDGLKGMTWLRKAADAGHTPAQRQLGTLSWGGTVPGIKPDLALSTTWLMKAAARGDRESAGKLLGNAREAIAGHLPAAWPNYAVETLRSLLKAGWTAAVEDLLQLGGKPGQPKLEKQEAAFYAALSKDLKAQGLAAS